MTHIVRDGRRMPRHIDLGQHAMSTMAHAMGRKIEWIAEPDKTNPHGLKTVMGFCLPVWQRPLVWSEAQMISFIESAWLGLNLGTYTYNIAPIGHPLDNLLIDGQQRMTAIERYLADAFPVFGYRWSETTVVDKRIWSMTTIFAQYRTETTDEAVLRDYYNLTNFGGTAHEPTERA